MADDEALKTVELRRKNSEVSCDIDNGDGTVDDHTRQDIDDPNKETKAPRRKVTPRTGVGNEARWGR